MKTVIVIQARMGSTRLPGKVLMPLDINPVLWWVNEAAWRAKPDAVVIATSELEQDNAIAEWCADNHIHCIRGSEADVLARFVKVAEETDADVLVRLTGDCPFHDPQVIREVITLREITGSDYASNVDPASYPDGLDVEVFTRSALMDAHQNATRLSDRDCVTRYISRNRNKFKASNLTCPIPGLHTERWVLDTEDDFKFCQEIASRIRSYPPSYLDILGILDREPTLRALNEHHPRNERFYEALATEEQEERFCPMSQKLLEQAEKLIPLGAQTFSKSKLQYPKNSPFFVTHGDGAYVYDVDGNDYVDLVSGLLPNILGYRDPDVDAAIRHQLSRGISFSMSTTLETELAWRLASHIPCAEMSRFGKTGTDVTTAAIRLARAYRGDANRVILKAKSGYHGWADWSVAMDPVRNVGVGYQNTAHFPYGDMKALEEVITRQGGHIAGIIVEPETNPDFLSNLREYCTETGIILIFDEIITGFRYGLGGAQSYWGVTPDLACFGKAMGNGMPISALCGKREIMQTMERISFSGTFFGETLSLAAAIATIDKLERECVIDHLWQVKSLLLHRIRLMISKYQLEDYISLSNDTPFTRIKFKDSKVRSLFMESMKENGVLIIASHNVNFAMKGPEVQKICKAYDSALLSIRAAIDNDYLKDIEEVAPTVRGAA